MTSSIEALQAVKADLEARGSFQSVDIGQRPPALKIATNAGTKMTNDTTAGKIADRIERIREAAQGQAGQEAVNALADCERALKRAAKRAETLSGEYERVEFVPSRGPRIEFTGRMLIQHAHASRKGLRIESEIWETHGGALVAMSASTPLEGHGYEDVRVTVIDPGEDIQAMRFAALDHFDWDQGVRKAATKAGWSLRREVD